MKHLERWQARQARDESGWGIIKEGSDKLGRQPQWVILPSKELDEQDAALIMAAHNAAIEHRPERAVYVNSITNTKLEPIIEIAIGPEVAHLKIREARQHAIYLMEAIEASMSDALLCRFIRDRVYHGVDDDRTKHGLGQMLAMFREFRDTVTNPVEESEQSEDKPA